MSISSEEIVIELEDVRCAWSEAWWSDRTDQFEGANLQLRMGEWCGLIGDNGLGKSTLLHGVAGTCPYVRGTIRVCGDLLRSRDIDQRQRFGRVYLVPQEPKCIATWRLDDIRNMAYGRRPGLEREEWIDGLFHRLSEVGVLDRQRRRMFTAAEARILIGLLIMPSVLLLDEAGQRLMRVSDSNDLSVKEMLPAPEFYALVRELLPATSVIFVEHDIKNAVAHSQKLLQLTLSSTTRGDVYSFKHIQPSELNIERANDRIFSSSSERTDEPSLPLLLLDQAVDEHLWISRRASRLVDATVASRITIAEQYWQFMKGAKRVDELSGGQKVILHSVMELLIDGHTNLAHDRMKHVSQTNIEKLRELGKGLGGS